MLPDLWIEANFSEAKCDYFDYTVFIGFLQLVCGAYNNERAIISIYQTNCQIVGLFDGKT